MKKILMLFSLLLVTGSLLIGQTVQISGTVTSSDDGTPVPGVFVQVKGTTMGAITGVDGKYVLNAPANTQILVFSFIGFKTTEVLIDGRTKIDIVLEVDVFKVDEIVVVGYGVQKKREVTGAISTVKGEALASLATPSFDAQLAGRSAGVQVTTTTGVLGETPRLRIRGVGSINSGTYPLVVVDGVPVFTGGQGGYASTNALGDINPADIESMEILKDGSGTAIYGSRAANGVILITTKKGSGGKFKANYTNYVGYASPVKLFDLLRASDFVMISNEKRSNRSQSAWAASDGTAYPGRTFDTDWQKAVLRENALQQDHNLSLSGSTEKSSYYISMGYTSQEGVTRPNEMKRYSMRVNLDQKIKKWFTIGSNVGVTRSDYFGLNTGTNALSGNIFSAIRQLPNTPIFDPNNNTGTGYNIEAPTTVPSNWTNLVGKWNNAATIGDNLPNIVYVINNNIYSSKVYRILANTFAQFEILPSLTFKTQIGIDNSLTEGFQYWNPLHGDGRSSGGFATNNFRNAVRWNLQNILTYTKSFGSHNFAAVLVNENQYEKRNNFFGQGTGLADSFYNQNLISGTYTVQYSGGGMSDVGFVSYAGRLNYNFAGKYFLQASLRYDGISDLPPDARWGLFPGGSVGWTVSKEPFMSGLQDIISDLKIRASYAKVGNTNIPNYPYLGLYGPAKYADNNGFGFGQFANVGLLWETSEKYDAGFDVLFLDGKYKFTFDYFLNNQDNLILDAPTPPSLGVPGNYVSRNIGSMKNWGYEFSGEANIINKGDFTWSVDANVTFAGNKIESLYQGLDVIGNYNILREGESIRAIFGYEYMGVNMANGFPLYKKADGSIVQGNYATSSYVAYLPADPTNVSVPAATLSNSDKKLLGPSIPKYFGAVNTRVSYKGFDFSVMARFSGGNYVMNRTRMDLMGMNFTNNSTEILNRWKSPTEPGNGWVPKLWASGSNFVNLSDQASTRWVEKGDFVKISTISIGYTFPKQMLTRVGIQNLRVFAQGQDMFMFTKYTGIDPEMEDSGVDYNGTPRQRVISVGLNVTL